MTEPQRVKSKVGRPIKAALTGYKRECPFCVHLLDQGDKLLCVEKQRGIRYAHRVKGCPFFQMEKPNAR